ncbi:hypothetical protein EZ428_22675 [Pedobacter frigiditerrae]|uniref:DUF5672 domain-containing protein n=1 Tax=Pedobacter frigiditerrae TaxID=2530452 RepID=A0A4R0MKA3_9SPHI|nr:DUF5672 family protein [Pedobacter frigiditerrae]TCC87011.1 hypothetical protein EZ428_22675 [Pedobacter frigiditerrae]
MKRCVVIFPLYQKPTAIELAFLENGLQLTKGFKQVIVAPEGLMVDKSFGQLEQLEVKRFAKHYFEGISGYNHLLLSKGFYTAFGLYDFMLIHQADVYLFKDELQAWCEKDYDYIGSPWFRPDKLNRNAVYNLGQKIKLSFKKNKIYGDRYNKVGNGGLSLRKISSALKVLAVVEQSLLNKYIKAEGDNFNEDIFWSLEAPLFAEFKIPQWEEGMKFAVEFHPAVAYNYLGETLPFGCHAPLKHNPEFWKKFIPIIK